MAQRLPHLLHKADAAACAAVASQLMAEQPAVASPVAFVTGASYRIGAATALALAHDGYDVAIAATRLSNLTKRFRRSKLRVP